MIKEVNKKETLGDLRMTAIIIIAFTILQIWAWQHDIFNVIRILSILFAILGVAILIRNRYDSVLKIKKEITDIETIKKIYREQRKKNSKKKFFNYF